MTTFTPDPTGTVVLCGSVTRAVAALDAAEAHYSALGYRVHKPVRDDSRTPQEHAERWYALIDAADVVVACTMQHQPVGKQTRRELERAFTNDIPVRLWVEASPLPAITRPNGKPYQPRKLSVASWDNDSTGLYPGDYGVLVLGTHDVDIAEPLATDHIRREWDVALAAMKPRLRWVRLGYADGEQAWVDDEVRGRAAVEFTAGDESEERAS